MSTLQLKSELHILIDHLQDNDVLNAVKTLLGRSVNTDTDFWDELSETDKAEINEGIEDIEAGRTYTYQEIFPPLLVFSTNNTSGSTLRSNL